jgi:hypothetical protein
MAIAAQGATEQGSRHAVGFKENIRARGQLNEMKLARQTFGPIGLIAQAPQGIRIARKKPELLRAPHAIEGQDEVEQIYEALDDGKTKEDLP